MSDAPNSIYMKPNDMYVNGWARPQYTDQFDDEGVGYTRSDLADALAAALREAEQSITRLIEAQGIDICTGCDTAVQLHAHRQDCAWSKIDAALAAYDGRK